MDLRKIACSLVVALAAAGCGGHAPATKATARSAPVRPGPGGSGTLPPGILAGPMPTAAAAPGVGNVMGAGTAPMAGPWATIASTNPPGIAGPGSAPAVGYGVTGVAGYSGTTGAQAGTSPSSVGGSPAPGAATPGTGAGVPPTGPSFLPSNVPDPVMGAIPPRIGEPSAAAAGTSSGPAMPPARLDTAGTRPLPPMQPPGGP